MRHSHLPFSITVVEQKGSPHPVRYHRQVSAEARDTGIWQRRASLFPQRLQDDWSGAS
jgi:hypothetical protein